MRQWVPTRNIKLWAVSGPVKAAGVALVIVAVGVGLLFAFWPDSESAVSGLSAAADDSAAAADMTTVAESSSPVSLSTTTTEPSPIEITIAAVGDVMGAQTVRWAAYDATTMTYDFYPMFAPVAPYLAGADYAVANLESCLADPGPNGQYIGFKRMNSPEALGEALEEAGFDLMALANNHSLDMGFDGIVQTLDRLDSIGLAHVGCYRSLEDKQARQPFIVDIEGIKVAFINYSDVTNGQYLAAQHKPYAVNFLGTEDAAAEAEAAREAGADLVVMIIHWGKEGQTKQNNAQIKVAQGTASYAGLLERGVDVILGAHPHVVQPAARVTYQTDSGARDTYVVYCMGNFLPDSLGWPQDGGLVVYVHIQKAGDETTVTGLSYLPVVRQRVPTDPEKVRLLPVLPGLTPQTDTVIADITKSRMDKAWNYYQEMYDRPEDNIVPLEPARLNSIEE